ncbi:hypothetical protein DES53_109155 [Roseimicrobium gellanilyticum]|uniref:Uncharacterized protein n=1 Tax=Roseimicrobium gellanilyticum TaxID=748857 RepID=A0A366HEI9_9BACT|nr:hypothetical protein [Roseimicrobium gellanilyticum]RBP39728.1 hypothetical protein DES53_109155 [Roseimicrobium gellanilyticum]
MIFAHKPAALILPGGTKVTYVEVADGERKGVLHSNRSGQPAYIHALEIKESTFDKIRAQLPRFIDRMLPGKRIPAGRTSGYESAAAQAFWFAIDGPFEPEDWRFFWVDDQGYESEVRHWHLSNPGEWLGVEGNVPRIQELLHLKVRSRTGEKDGDYGTPSRGSLPGIAKDGILGEVVAEMKFQNPLRRTDLVNPLTAQPLPAKVSVDGHELVLKGATRARIASDRTFGLHLDLALEGEHSLTSLFSLHDWTIEDGNGNVMVPGHGMLSETGQLWDCAPWSDAPVWKIRFVPVLSDPKNYTDEEIITLDPMPVPVYPRKKDINTWRSERLVGKSTTITARSPEPMGPNEIVFDITITPAVNGHSLQLLHATDESGSQTVQTRYGQEKYAMSLASVAPAGSTAMPVSTELVGRCRRPTTGKTLTVTLAFKKVTPVEFTFRPEFEP